MCVVCDVDDRWTICEDLTTDLDANSNDCDWYLENLNDCGGYDTTDFLAVDMCCSCFNHDMGVPEYYYDMADFNLPACPSGDCTFYSASNPGADYYETFAALTNSVDSPNVSPAAGETVYSYFEITDWWIDNQGPFNEMTITPVTLDGSGNVEADQPDFSEWIIESSTIRTYWTNLEDNDTYDENIWFEFLMLIPADWDDRDYSTSATMTWMFQAEVSVGDLYTFTLTTDGYASNGEWTMTMAAFDGDWDTDYERMES